MTKPTIVTRSGKGSALTWTEGDANLTNLQDATITVRAGTGGTDVVSDLNGTVTLVAGTNISLSGDNTAKTVTINNTASAGIASVSADTSPALGGNLNMGSSYKIYNSYFEMVDNNPNGTFDIKAMSSHYLNFVSSSGTKLIFDGQYWPKTSGSANQYLKTDAYGNLSWATVSSGGIATVSEDTTPSLGGNLNVAGNSIVSVSNGNITLAPNGTGKVIINGNLQIDGSTTTVNSTTVTVDDPIITLGGDTAPSADDNKDRGVEFRWHNGTTAKVGFFGYDDSTGYLTFIPDATNTSEVFSGTQGDIQATNFRGALIGNADTATTATNANNINISTTNGNTSDTTLYPVLVGAAATGNQLPHIDSTDLTFNASTAVLTSTGFAGALNGTVGATTPSTGAFTTASTTSTLTANSTTANSPKLTIGTGALSSTAWTTSGIGLRISTATYTDTSSTAGTIAASHGHAIAAPTLASTNAITVTDAATLYISGDVISGTNTTITNNWALLTPGDIKAGTFTGSGSGLSSIPNAGLTNSSITFGATATSLGGTVSALNSVTIGATTASTGAFTTLSASSTVGLSGANAAITISPTGTGTVAISPAGALTINPTAASTINNCSIGATTAATGRFTTITSTQATGTAPFTVASTTNVANLNASSLNGATFAAPGAIGSGTASTGAFTTLSASSTVSGTGFSTYLASPPAIGATTASTGAFTTLSASSTVSGTGFSTYLASPPAIGATTASTGAFTTLSASSTVSGTGFSTYLASPPAIGGTTAAAGTFTTLTSTGATTIKDLRETIFTGGTTTGTITPNVANGTIQSITLTGSITFNAFASPVAGQSLTLIITQSASGGLTLTSTMKFSGASKTLSTAANAVDILTVFYDGTNYWASLGKGFA